jgi:aryl-alcohol dehydrogenase-like predicted oxidoreductase
LRLGLGTAQFGFPYGISNSLGKPAPEEVKRIIDVARLGGIKIIDTAHDYGDSEAVIGRCLDKHSQFNIVTKSLPLRKSCVTSEDVDHVLAAFHLSLDRLRQPAVYALLAHNAGDLLVKDGGQLMDALSTLKTNGLVQKVGVSVYDQIELDAVLERFDVDIVQIPFNVLDQRLLMSGSLARLKHAGVEVHARSVFLQGLLLMEPDSLGKHFLAAQSPIRRLRDFARERGRTLLETALRFVAERKEIDCAIIGVSRHEELHEIFAAFQGEDMAEDYSGFAINDESILNPARWPY